MARSVRVEFPGVFYHVMARGNRHNPSSTARKRMCQDLHTDPQFSTRVVGNAVMQYH
jgi:hypothetical protein